MGGGAWPRSLLTSGGIRSGLSPQLAGAADVLVSPCCR